MYAFTKRPYLGFHKMTQNGGSFGRQFASESFYLSAS
jgi:hypothetical protein